MLLVPNVSCEVHRSSVTTRLCSGSCLANPCIFDLLRAGAEMASNAWSRWVHVF